MRRMLPPLIVLVLVAAACTVQQAPDRSALPDVAGELVPDFLVPSDPFATLANSHGCAVVASDGVRVLEVVSGAPADGLLAVADVIVTVGGVPTTSAEALRRVIATRAPGDVLTLGVERGEGIENVEVELAQLTEDQAVGQIGLMLESRLVAHTLDEVPSNFVDAGLARPMVLDGQLVVYDPLGAAWQTTGIEVPSQRLAAVDGSLYITAATPQPAVIRLNDGAVAVLNNTQWQPLWPLGSIDGLVLVAANAVAGDPTTTAVLAIDFEEQSLEWAWETGAGEVIVPQNAYPAPNGGLAVVTLTVAGDDESTTSRHVMLDRLGQELTGYPSTSRQFLPDGSIIGGWYDADRVVYASTANGSIVARSFDPASGEDSLLATLESDRVNSLWAVGDGQHVLVADGPDITLVDIEASSRRRPVFAGCEFGSLGDYGGFVES